MLPDYVFLANLPKARIFCKVSISNNAVLWVPLDIT